jgi:hypothetical protein
MPAPETPVVDAADLEFASTAERVAETPEPPTPDPQWSVRGELFRTLYGTLSGADQQWVASKIRHYLQANAEQHIEARL